MEQRKEVYFTNEALARFASAQGKVVEKIVCHLWQNTFSAETVEIIDNVQLIFVDGQKLTISCNDDGTGLDAIEYDPKAVAKSLKEEFEGRIKLFQVDASMTKMWMDVPGKILQAVQISRDGEFYLADSVMLNFGEEKRTVSIGPLDGLIIDYFEEV